MPSNGNWSFGAKKFQGQINVGKPEWNKASECLTKDLLKALMCKMHWKTVRGLGNTVTFPPPQLRFQRNTLGNVTLDW